MTEETNGLIERLRKQIEHSRQFPDSPLTLGSLIHALSDAIDRLEALSAECEALQRDLAAILCQTRGAEDLEPGCCAPCRARTTLQQTNKEIDRG